MPEKKLLRVVVDTNVLISALIGKRLKPIIQSLKAGKFRLVFTETTFEELILVLKSPKFEVYFSKHEIEDLIWLLQTNMELIRCDFEITDCRDWKDNIFLECALAGDIDYIVSEDDDLLTMNPFRGVAIIPPAEFLNLLI